MSSWFVVLVKAFFLDNLLSSCSICCLSSDVSNYYSQISYFSLKFWGFLFFVFFLLHELEALLSGTEYIVVISPRRVCLPMWEMQEMWVRFLGQEDLLEEETATHSSISAWEIPWTEEPGRLQAMVLQRIRHDWNDLACTYVTSCQVWMHWPFYHYKMTFFLSSKNFVLKIICLILI